MINHTTEPSLAKESSFGWYMRFAERDIFTHHLGWDGLFYGLVDYKYKIVYLKLLLNTKFPPLLSMW